MQNMTGDVSSAPVQPVSRWAEREARRLENARIASEAAHARATRARKSLVEQVELAKAVLNGKNVAGAIQTIQGASPKDYDIYLLAEIHGQARSGVLKQFGPPRNSVRTAYEAEVGVGDPEQTPDGAKE